MIEGDNERFKDLGKNIKQYPNIIPVNKFVESVGDNSLDKILKKIIFQLIMICSQ